MHVLKAVADVACIAAIAQLGERQTEDLKVPGSIPGHGKILFDVLGPCNVWHEPRHKAVAIRCRSAATRTNERPLHLY